MSQSSWVWLEGCTIERVTDKAVLLWHGETQYWLPLSQISEPDRLKTGDANITVGITEWIASQKGIKVDD